MAKIVQTTKMAAEQVIITMAVNFPRIETLYRELISVLCRGRRVTHDGGQGQQFGAEFQSGAIRSVRIYEETDTALIDSKLDDTAGGGKSIRFTDDENVLATQLGGDLGQTVAFASGNEKDLAADYVGSSLHTKKSYGATLNSMPEQRVVERAAEGVGPENTNQKGRLGICECAGRPFNKFCKIEKKSGF
jgi:hypothetical protein